VQLLFGAGRRPSFPARLSLWMDSPWAQSHGCYWWTILFMRPTFYYLAGMASDALRRIAAPVLGFPTHNPTQPTKSMSYMTSAYFGSPRGLVSSPSTSRDQPLHAHPGAPACAKPPSCNPQCAAYKWTARHQGACWRNQHRSIEGKQFATTKSRRHSQQPHQATNWNFGRNIDTSQEAHRAEFSPFSFAPSNPFLSNLYLGHDRMTMDKRGSP
jgi:hypothetical protein